MRGPKPQLIELTEKQQEILEHIERERTQPHGLVTRAQIVLAAAAGQNNQQIADQLQIRRGTVRQWRKRWRQSANALALIPEGDLREQIAATLADAPRSGAPATFTAEQLCQVVAVACEKPEASGRPVTHWTPTELAAEVIQRGIVPQISPRSVGRFLK
jgi:putative transposase